MNDQVSQQLKWQISCDIRILFYSKSMNYLTKKEKEKGEKESRFVIFTLLFFMYHQRGVRKSIRLLNNT